jgi:hypothetical protein
MKTIFRSIILVLTGMLVLLSTRPGSAQDEPPLTVDVDRTSLSTNETLSLTITVATSSVSIKAPQPQLPPLDGFNVVGSSTSSQISIINGEVSTQTTYRYVLQPNQTGELTIEPVTLTIGRQIYQSDPITIQVTEGASTPPQAAQDEAEAPDKLSGQEFYVEADVDNLTPYMGQSVIYTFYFYQSISLYNQPFYAPPSFTGFWSENQAEQSQYTREINGITYRITELSTILFPTSSGPITIEAGTLTIRGGGLDPDVKLVAEPIRLDVRPLPDNAPSSFNGAVGQFSIDAQVDDTEGKVNEPITLIVTISGSGNIHNLPDPAWPEIPGWRSFERQATINTAIESGEVTGSRIYERLLVPGQAGDFTMPAIEFVFFDLQLAEYRTISTQPIPVSISPGETEDDSTIIVGSDKETVELLASDIRHIKPVPSALNTARKPLTAQVIYWAAWLLPLLVIAGSYAWDIRQSYLLTHPDLVRSSRAYRKASKALTMALKEQEDVYNAAGRVLTGYLSDKLNLQVTGLTRNALARQLAERNIQPELVEHVKNSLSYSEVGRFSPEDSEADLAGKLLEDTKMLISELERAF